MHFNDKEYDSLLDETVSLIEIANSGKMNENRAAFERDVYKLWERVVRHDGTENLAGLVEYIVLKKSIPRAEFMFLKDVLEMAYKPNVFVNLYVYDMMLDKETEGKTNTVKINGSFMGLGDVRRGHWVEYRTLINKLGSPVFLKLILMLNKVKRYTLNDCL